MSDVSLNGRRLNAASVVRLAPGQELAAAAAAKSNGADDVIVRVGADHFAVSGRGLALGKVKPNDAVTIDGQVGRVVSTDTQLNSFGEGMKAWPGLVVGGVGVTWGVVGLVQGLMAGSAFAGLGVFVALAGVAAGLAVNLIPAAYGALRQVDYQALNPFAK